MARYEDLGNGYGALRDDNDDIARFVTDKQQSTPKVTVQNGYGFKPHKPRPAPSPKPQKYISEETIKRTEFNKALEANKQEVNDKIQREANVITEYAKLKQGMDAVQDSISYGGNILEFTKDWITGDNISKALANKEAFKQFMISKGAKYYSKQDNPDGVEGFMLNGQFIPITNREGWDAFLHGLSENAFSAALPLATTGVYVYQKYKPIRYAIKGATAVGAAAAGGGVGSAATGMVGWAAADVAMGQLGKYLDDTRNRANYINDMEDAGLGALVYFKKADMEQRIATLNMAIEQHNMLAKNEDKIKFDPNVANKHLDKQSKYLQDMSEGNLAYYMKGQGDMAIDNTMGLLAADIVNKSFIAAAKGYKAIKNNIPDIPNTPRSGIFNTAKNVANSVIDTTKGVTAGTAVGGATTTALTSVGVPFELSALGGLYAGYKVGKTVKNSSSFIKSGAQKIKDINPNSNLGKAKDFASQKISDHIETIKNPSVSIDAFLTNNLRTAIAEPSVYNLFQSTAAEFGLVRAPNTLAQKALFTTFLNPNSASLIKEMVENFPRTGVVLREMFSAFNNVFAAQISKNLPTNSSLALTQIKSDMLAMHRNNLNALEELADIGRKLTNHKRVTGDFANNYYDVIRNLNKGKQITKIGLPSKFVDKSINRAAHFQSTNAYEKLGASDPLHAKSQIDSNVYLKGADFGDLLLIKANLSAIDDSSVAAIPSLASLRIETDLGIQSLLDGISDTAMREALQLKLPQVLNKIATFEKLSKNKYLGKILQEKDPDKIISLFTDMMKETSIIDNGTAIQQIMSILPVQKRAQLEMHILKKIIDDFTDNINSPGQAVINSAKLRGFLGKVKTQFSTVEGKTMLSILEDFSNIFGDSSALMKAANTKIPSDLSGQGISQNIITRFHTMFASKLTRYIKQNYMPGHSGLTYRTGKVISSLLKDPYNININKAVDNMYQQRLRDFQNAKTPKQGQEAKADLDTIKTTKSALSEFYNNVETLTKPNVQQEIKVMQENGASDKDIVDTIVSTVTGEAPVKAEQNRYIYEEPIKNMHYNIQAKLHDLQSLPAEQIFENNEAVLKNITQNALDIAENFAAINKTFNLKEYINTVIDEYNKTLPKTQAQYKLPKVEDDFNNLLEETMQYRQQLKQQAEEAAAKQAEEVAAKQAEEVAAKQAEEVAAKQAEEASIAQRKAIQERQAAERAEANKEYEAAEAKRKAEAKEKAKEKAKKRYQEKKEENAKKKAELEEKQKLIAVNAEKDAEKEVKSLVETGIKKPEPKKVVKEKPKKEVKEDAEKEIKKEPKKEVKSLVETGIKKPEPKKEVKKEPKKDAKQLQREELENKVTQLEKALEHAKSPMRDDLHSTRTKMEIAELESRLNKAKDALDDFNIIENIPPSERRQLEQRLSNTKESIKEYEAMLKDAERDKLLATGIEAKEKAAQERIDKHTKTINDLKKTIDDIRSELSGKATDKKKLANETPAIFNSKAIGREVNSIRLANRAIKPNAGDIEYAAKNPSKFMDSITHSLSRELEVNGLDNTNQLVTLPKFKHIVEEVRKASSPEEYGKFARESIEVLSKVTDAPYIPNKELLNTIVPGKSVKELNSIGIKPSDYIVEKLNKGSVKLQIDRFLNNQLTPDDTIYFLKNIDDAVANSMKKHLDTSKIWVDKQGNPIVFYRGTNKEEGNKTLTQRGIKHDLDNELAGDLVWMTRDIMHAKYFAVDHNNKVLRMFALNKDNRITNWTETKTFDSKAGFPTEYYTDNAILLTRPKEAFDEETVKVFNSLVKEIRDGKMTAIKLSDDTVVTVGFEPTAELGKKNTYTSKYVAPGLGLFILSSLYGFDLDKNQ